MGGGIILNPAILLVARLFLFYCPILCLSSALSHRFYVVCVSCYIGLAACNKSSFVFWFVDRIESMTANVNDFNEQSVGLITSECLHTMQSSSCTRILLTR